MLYESSTLLARVTLKKAVSEAWLPIELNSTSLVLIVILLLMLDNLPVELVNNSFNSSGDIEQARKDIQQAREEIDQEREKIREELKNLKLN